VRFLTFCALLVGRDCSAISDGKTTRISGVFGLHVAFMQALLGFNLKPQPIV
jgi:hypothetical protein